MTEKLIFNGAMEGLMQSVRTDVSPRCRSRLKDLGFDVGAKSMPAYPAELWAGIVTVLAEEIYPSLSPHDGERKLAMRTVEVFAQGVIGGAMFTVANLLGPDRTVRRMTRNFRTSSNFLETSCTEIAPHTYEIFINDVSGVPGFYAGLLEGGFLKVGARELSVVIHDKTEPSATYRVNWAA